MGRTEVKKYCDRKEAAEAFFQEGCRGQAMYWGVAYPTENSHGITACGQALSVGRDSFLRRPSLCDEAVENISGFINQDIYMLQEPRKTFFCHTAQLFVLRGKARALAAGKARVLHFRDGKLEGASKPQEQILGEKIAWKAELEEEIDLARGSHVFVLLSGKAAEEESFLEKRAGFWKGRKDAGLGKNAEGLLSEELQKEILQAVQGQHCSAAVIALPERARWKPQFLKGRAK